jgi:hypothetical protein
METLLEIAIGVGAMILWDLFKDTVLQWVKEHIKKWWEKQNFSIQSSTL